MNKFIQEYGRLLIAIVAVGAFFVIIGFLLSVNTDSGNSIYKTQANEMQSSTNIYGEDYYYTDDGDNYDDDSVADDTTNFSAIVNGDIVKNDIAPYFKIADDVSYSITTDAFRYADLFKYVRVMYKDNDITNMTKTNDDLDVKITILAYEYTPVLDKNPNDLNYHIVMEEVDATDKFGRYIYDTDGVTRLKTKQPKYKISESVVFGTNNYIDTTEQAYKVKILYRVQVGEYKAECMVTYIKNKVGSVVTTTGLTKLNFIYKE